MYDLTLISPEANIAGVCICQCRLEHTQKVLNKTKKPSQTDLVFFGGVTRIRFVFKPAFAQPCSHSLYSWTLHYRASLKQTRKERSDGILKLVQKQQALAKFCLHCLYSWMLPNGKSYAYLYNKSRHYRPHAYFAKGEYCRRVHLLAQVRAHACC